MEALDRKELNKKELKEQYAKRPVTGGVYKITCKETGEFWLRSTQDMKGALNRFNFSKSMNMCPEFSLKKTWLQHPAESFVFDVVEEITKEETQTDVSFLADVQTLLDMCILEHKRL